MNDVRKMIYGTVIGFFLVMGIWFGIVYVSACGFTFTCNRGGPLVIRTPIPTLIPAVHSESRMEPVKSEFDKCQVAAADLIGAWVSAGYSATETFPFVDADGQPCEGTFEEDIRPLFVENNLWRPNSLGCVSCHNSSFSNRSAGLDMTTYDALLLGSRRAAESASEGTDIFGGGKWEKSLLHEFLVNRGLVPDGHSADTPASDLVVFAGSRVDETATTSP
jgi:hypothetical protein